MKDVAQYGFFEVQYAEDEGRHGWTPSSESMDDRVDSPVEGSLRSWLE